MQILFIILITTISSSVFAKGITINWSCPVLSPSDVSVNVSYNEQGKIVLKPDIFSNKSKTNSPEVYECIRAFQAKLNRAVAEFKKANCPASYDDFCYAGIEYSVERINQYIRVSELYKRNLPTADNKPSVESPQNHLQSLVDKNEIDLKDLSKTFSYEGKDYVVSDFDSVIGENIEKVFKKFTQDEAKQYAQNYLLQKASVLKVPSAAKNQVLANLEKMFGYIHGEQGEDELKNAIECLPPTLPNVEPLQDLLSSIKEKDKCGELKPGQNRLFEKDLNNYNGTGNYLLKRKPDGNYQVVLNMKFIAGPGGVTPLEMMERTKGCLAEASPFMKGPNGENLEITALTPDEVRSQISYKERMVANEVTIEGPNFISNSGAYNEKVDCSVITHEVLHLLGLCDEYQEDRPELAKYGWTCRVVTTAPSIMRDTRIYQKVTGSTVSCGCDSNLCSSVMNSKDERLKTLYNTTTFYDLADPTFRISYCKEVFLPEKENQSTPTSTMQILSSNKNNLELESRFVNPLEKEPFYKFYRTKINCICPEDDTNCLKLMSEVQTAISKPSLRSFCPIESKELGRTTGTQPQSLSLKDKVFQIAIPPEYPSLLQPNHFFKILEGGCKGKSSGYQECADHAYKSDPCNVSEKCQDDKYYLGTKQ